VTVRITTRVDEGDMGGKKEKNVKDTDEMIKK
jgi:hypothetical protein